MSALASDADERAALADERDHLVERLDRGHREYFGGFGGATGARRRRADPPKYRQAEDLWIALLRRYEAVCDRLAVLDAHIT